MLLYMQTHSLIYYIYFFSGESSISQKDLEDLKPKKEKKFFDVKLNSDWNVSISRTGKIFLHLIVVSYIINRTFKTFS
jgi:hypothetical protein